MTRNNETQHPPLVMAIFGPPGSGKGTQAALLVERFNFVHLATGDMLREEIRHETALGQRAEALIAEGRLVPDDLVGAMVERHIEEPLRMGQPILLDGYPRTLGQLEFLNRVLAKRGADLNAVLFLDIDAERLVARLEGRRVCDHCGASYHVVSFPPRVEGVCDLCQGRLVRRPDDNREAILHRLDVYRKQTYPVLEAVEEEGKLIRVDADRERDPIFEEAAGRIERLGPAGCGSCDH